MRPDEIIEKHNERHEWLDAVSKRMNELSRELRNNLGIMELIVSNFKKKGGQGARDLGVTLNSIERSKQALDQQTSFPTLEDVIKRPFELKEAFGRALNPLEVMLRTKKITLNVQGLDFMALQGDAQYFSLALGILFCYTIERLKMDGQLFVSLKKDESGFLRIKIHSHDALHHEGSTGFKDQLLEDVNISRAHLIFQEHGGGFVFNGGEQSGFGFEALWPIQA